MKLIVICYSDDERRVFIPTGQPEPRIVHPKAWVGNWSPHASKGISLQIGSMLGTEATLFVANGEDVWHPNSQYGWELLHLLKPTAGWEFAEVLLPVWLSYVFGVQVKLEYREHQPA